MIYNINDSWNEGAHIFWSTYPYFHQWAIILLYGHPKGTDFPTQWINFGIFWWVTKSSSAEYMYMTDCVRVSDRTTTLRSNNIPKIKFLSPNDHQLTLGSSGQDRHHCRRYRRHRRPLPVLGPSVCTGWLLLLVPIEAHTTDSARVCMRWSHPTWGFDSFGCNKSVSLGRAGYCCCCCRLAGRVVVTPLPSRCTFFDKRIIFLQPQWKGGNVGGWVPL